MNAAGNAQTLVPKFLSVPLISPLTPGKKRPPKGIMAGAFLASQGGKNNPSGASLLKY